MEYEQADALNTAIRTINIRHRARAAAKLATLGLHPGQEVVLLLLVGGAKTQKQLAVEAGCEPPSITVMVRKLEAAGLVSRRTSELDARSVVVTLTRQGSGLIKPLKRLWRELAEETIAGLTSTPTDQLLSVLADLARGLQAGTRAESH